MPNFKIFADSAIRPTLGETLKEELPALATILMERLEVGRPACQLALIWVEAPADQPALNIELSIMPGPKRQRAMLEELARELQARITALGAPQPAIRISQLDAATYVALK